ncbi:hypothetical protein HNY73_016560 [Argiope bruennichi]|uniref:Uncharacterized protein n=1 Tax=Argiope bruennichi TaxID=94029 RepID=A0A8T0EN50_ARGBR|nr:hypothetical protein HNY73_016560 [Argiope bruennichi]
MSSAEKAKIGNGSCWPLQVSKEVMVGDHPAYPRSFWDTKRDGLSMKSETKLILKRLLETGHLKKKDGKICYQEM